MPGNSKYNPPRWVRKLLASLLEPRLLEACLGDLEEKFRHRQQKNLPGWKVKFLYVLEALGFLKMARRQSGESNQTTVNMIKHTLLFFTRLVKKDKSYYLVSLVGLTLSLASFLLIMMFINDELAYDRFHENRERIFRVVTHIRLGDVNYDQATSQFPMAQALSSEMEEIEEAIRIFRQNPELEYGEKKFRENVIMPDESFFRVFSFPLLLGDPEKALTEPSNIILTRATAKKYFGTENPIGKTLLVNGTALSVAGVIDDVPEQSHLKFTAIIPLALQLNQWKKETGLEGRENKWFWTGAYTYIQLKKKTEKKAIDAKLPLIIQKYFPERYRAGGSLELQPLTDIHLRSSLDAEMEPGGSMLYLRLFSIVAFVIMIVSSINLINLSYFKISSRIREMGIRKFLGQNGARIVAQLSLESIILGVLAFVMSIVVSQLAITSFNLLVQKNIYLWTGTNIKIIIATLALIIFISVVAVFRPAIHFANRSSSYLLLQNYRSPGRARLRNLLMGLQVCFSFVLLVFSFIISSQIDFFKKKELGFDKENVITVALNEDFNDNQQAFKNELKKSKDIINVAGGTVPGLGCDAWRFVPEGGSYDKPLMFPFTWVDADFLKTLDIKLLAGNNFDPVYRNDSIWPFIINKRAAVELGWMDDPINRTMEIFAPGTTEIMAKGRIIGLMDDYHFESLHNPVKPIVLTPAPWFETAIIRVSGTSTDEGIHSIGATWKNFSDKPFTYEVLDQTLEKLYDKESRLSNVILFFTIIGLYLTCYGMFAMSSLLFSNRLKEVAIRKVFGAGQFAVIKQLYARYALFNLVAIVVGVPVALYLGNLWLQTFQFHIELNPSLFIKAALCILIAGLLSVSYYLTRVAYSNPVKFLRRE